MTLSNWLLLALMVIIIIVGVLLLRYFRRKLYSMDGFEGILTERGRPFRRIKLDIIEETEHLLEILNRK